MEFFSFDGRMKVFAPSELHDHVSTHNNILGVTLSGDFGDVCTLSDLRPNRSWAIPHNCLIIVSAHNIDRAEAAAAIPSLAMSWPSLQFGSIRGQHLQAVSYVLS